MNKTGGMVEGHFYFDPDDLIYIEHFPGHPVVPGSMIVHAFVTAAAESVWQSVPATIQNFRFKRFIPPGNYRYRIQEKGAHGDLACQLYDGQDVVVTGHLTR